MSIQRRWAGRRIVLAVVGVLLAAPACQQEIGLSASCDIRKTRCQDDIFYAVQQLRGSGWDPWLDRPPMRVITAEAYRQELLAAEAATPAQDDEEPVDHFEAVLELLLLLDPARQPTASTDASVNNVAGFYSPRTKAMTIIDHGSAGDLVYGTTVLGHELVHAAQDREIGLYGGQTRDASWARTALTEGEAELYEGLLYQAVTGEEGYDPEAYLANVQRRVVATDSPEYILGQLRYPLGLRFMTERYLAGGNVAVRRAWADVPRTVHTLMAIGTDIAPQLDNDMSCLAPEPPSGYQLVGQQGMGAWSLFGVASRFAGLADDVAPEEGAAPEEATAQVRAVKAERAWEIALGWQGDRLWYYGDDDGQTLLVWQLRLAAPQARAFIDGAAALYGDGAVTSGDGVVYVLRSTAAVPAQEELQKCRGADD